MFEHIKSFLRRFSFLVDKSALFLILPCAAALYFIDPAMFATLLQWVVFAPVLAGIAIIVSRVTFPQIELTKLVKEAELENRAAGLVVAAIILFVGITMLSLVLWAKA
ncbi:hypothetical protein D3C76_388830 [compost metagenome]